MQKELGHLGGLDSVPLRSQGTRGRSERLADPSLTKHYRVEEAKYTLLFMELEDGQESLGLEGWRARAS